MSDHKLTEANETRAQLYHGARSTYAPGDRLNPGGGEVFFTADVDAAIWAAELCDGEDQPRVYQVRVVGAYEDSAEEAGYVAPRHPAMTLRTCSPVEVLDEVTRWSYYHGTRAELAIGALIEPGHLSNFGEAPRRANFVYFTRTLDASIWGAELAVGEGPGRIYRVEPTGPIEDDPNLTNVRFRGNPTKSFRSRAPLRVLGEVTGWTGHPPEVVQRMREGLAQLAKAGVVADD